MDALRLSILRGRLSERFGMKRMGSFLVSSVVLEQALDLPDECSIQGAEWDFETNGLRLFVEGPGLPAVPECGAVPRIQPLIACITDSEGRQRLDWNWNVGDPEAGALAEQQIEAAREVGRVAAWIMDAAQQAEWAELATEAVAIVTDARLCHVKGCGNTQSAGEWFPALGCCLSFCESHAAVPEAGGRIGLSNWAGLGKSILRVWRRLGACRRGRSNVALRRNTVIAYCALRF